MSEQDKVEIRKIIIEEIEAKFGSPVTRPVEETANVLYGVHPEVKAINIETVSPAY
jgi:hypothetical protein